MTWLVSLSGMAYFRNICVSLVSYVCIKGIIPIDANARREAGYSHAAFGPRDGCCPMSVTVINTFTATFSKPAHVRYPPKFCF